MGSTLEAQKKKAPKPKKVTYRDRDDLEIGRAITKKKKRIVVTPDKPYYSSKSLEKGYKERFPSAMSSAELRKRSPFGTSSPRAALQDVLAKGINMFRDEEGQRGSRTAEKVAEEVIKRNDGGMARKTRVF
tara:strand:+ start:2817 stop:3209 length:393 start_codon:yes stop_codon:yes gene_type:complete